MSKTVARHSPPVAGRTYSERLNHQEFSRRLYQMLVDRGWKQSELARRCFGEEKTKEGHKVARGRDRISAYVNGKAVPDPSNLQKLAKALDVSIEELAPEITYETMKREQPDFYIHKVPGKDEAFVSIHRTMSLHVAGEIFALLLRHDALGPDAEKSQIVGLNDGSHPTHEPVGANGDL